MPISRSLMYKLSVLAALVLGQQGVQCFVVQPAWVRNCQGGVFPSTCLSVASSSSSSSTDTKTGKQIENAKKRIAELDRLVEQADEKIENIDATMILSGDEDELFDLQKEKERIEKQIAKYLKEWDDLEAMLESMNPID